MPKWCDEGETDVGNIYLKNQVQNPSLYLGLYINPAEPAETDTLAQITEPVGAGYARIPLAPADWTESPQGTFTQPQKTFTAIGGNWGNVYGCFIATSPDGTGKLLAVEHFSDGPYNIMDGSQVKVTPQLTIS
jgi:hypothetical protein